MVGSACSIALLPTSPLSPWVLKDHRFQQLLKLTNHPSLKFNVIFWSSGSSAFHSSCNLRAFSTIMWILINFCREYWWQDHVNRACYSYRLALDCVGYFFDVLTVVRVVDDSFVPLRTREIVDFPGVFMRPNAFLSHKSISWHSTIHFMAQYRLMRDSAADEPCQRGSAFALQLEKCTS